MLIAVYLFAGFLAGFALVGVLFALANRHGEETSTGCEHVWEPWGEGVKTMYYVRLRQMALDGTGVTETGVAECASCLL